MVHARGNESDRRPYLAVARWGLIFCAVLIVATQSIGQVVSRDHANRPAEDQKGAAADQTPAAQSVVSSNIRSAPQCPPSAQLAGNQNSKGAQNGNGFWQANVTDWAIVALTVGLFVVGYIQVKIYKRQARLMLGALKATSRSNLVAARTARAAAAATEALPKVERAYVFLSDEIEFRHPTPASGLSGAIGASAVIAFTNHGKTPAILTGMDVVRGYRERLPPVFDGPTGGPVGVVIGTGQRWPWPDSKFPVTPEEWERARNDDGRILICGRVCYEDVFGHPHETGFCWEFNF